MRIENKGDGVPHIILFDKPKKEQERDVVKEALEANKRLEEHLRKINPKLNKIPKKESELPKEYADFIKSDPLPPIVRKFINLLPYLLAIPIAGYAIWRLFA